MGYDESFKGDGDDEDDDGPSGADCTGSGDTWDVTTMCASLAFLGLRALSFVGCQLKEVVER